MKVSYKKLWKRLIDSNLNKSDLQKITGLSSRSIAKLGRSENMTTDSLVKICEALHCDICDIIGLEEEEENGSSPMDSPVTSVNFKINSFFAGIGGFDLAFERHGFKTQFLCEINSYCNSVLSSHWPDVQKANDICKLDPNTLPKAEVWCGGFPCQDISVARGASQRLGLDGARSGLFYQYARLLDVCKPEVVIIENVAGLFNSNGGRDFGVIIQRMTSMGYAVAWRLLNSRYFGVPQSRPRVYMCCWHMNPHKAIEAMFDPQGAFVPENERLDFIEQSTPHGQYPIVPRVSFCLAATSGRHTGTDWSRTYVVCKDGVRRMTPIEYERLQGFPDLWTLPSSYTNDDDTDTLRYTAIGNAVSVPVVEWLAQRIHNLLLVSDRDFDISEDFVAGYRDFAKSTWTSQKLSDIDFMDAKQTFKWQKAGLAWNDRFIEAKTHPTPSEPVLSSLYDVMETGNVGKRYYLTPNAAEGILRRVDTQGRKLFSPLYDALKRESLKK